MAASTNLAAFVPAASRFFSRPPQDRKRRTTDALLSLDLRRLQPSGSWIDPPELVPRHWTLMNQLLLLVRRNPMLSVRGLSTARFRSVLNRPAGDLNRGHLVHLRWESSALGEL